MTKPRPLPASVDDALALLGAGRYVADRSLATAVFLAMRLNRPLFLEGEAGVGKTEIAKVLAETLGRRLIRLQCYEGLDTAAAVYEWNYPRQMIEIRLAEAGQESRETVESEIFSDRFLIRRPLLQALSPDPAGPPVLLIDELDRADEPFEAYLLEVLSDYQVTIPELGTVKAPAPPIVVVTSNRTREIHDALKRRCFYYWVDYPNAERELEILPQVAGCGRGALPPGRRLHPEAAQGRAVQGPRHRRDAGLDARPGRARPCHPRPGDDQRHAGHAAQVPGRHRQDPRPRSGAHPARGRDRARCCSQMSENADSGAPEGALTANLMHFAARCAPPACPSGPDG
jgi:hypothetical protein